MQNKKIVETLNADRIETASKPLMASSHEFKSISIIFPAFNEEKNILKSVEQAREVISKFFDDFEIIVVNDGSHDGTGTLISELEQSASYLVSVHHENNKGYGTTLRSGIERASKELVFFTDSDLQFDINDIEHLLECIHDNDIVAGYRVNRADPLIRRVNAWGWNVLVRLALGLKIRDIDCAFKLFRKSVFDDIQLESVGAMINTEILTLALWNGMRITEIPVQHFPRKEGTQTGANLNVILKALRELVFMRKNLRPVRKQEISESSVNG